MPAATFVFGASESTSSVVSSAHGFNAWADTVPSKRPGSDAPVATNASPKVKAVRLILPMFSNYSTRRRRMVSTSPIASNRTLDTARSGHELAVFGNVADEPAGVDPDDPVVDRAAVFDGAFAAAGGAPAAFAFAALAAVGTVACTSFSVMMCGGCDVT